MTESALDTLEKAVVADLVEHPWANVEEIVGRLRRSAESVVACLTRLEKRQLVQFAYFADGEDEEECWAIHCSRCSEPF